MVEIVDRMQLGVFMIMGHILHCRGCAVVVVITIITALLNLMGMSLTTPRNGE